MAIKGSVPMEVTRRPKTLAIKPFDQGLFREAGDDGQGEDEEGKILPRAEVHRQQGELDRPDNQGDPGQ